MRFDDTKAMNVGYQSSNLSASNAWYGLAFSVPRWLGTADDDETESFSSLSQLKTIRLPPRFLPAPTTVAQHMTTVEDACAKKHPPVLCSYDAPSRTIQQARGIEAADEGAFWEYVEQISRI